MASIYRATDAQPPPAQNNETPRQQPERPPQPASPPAGREMQQQQQQQPPVPPPTMLTARLADRDAPLPGAQPLSELNARRAARPATLPLKTAAALDDGAKPAVRPLSTVVQNAEGVVAHGGKRLQSLSLERILAKQKMNTEETLSSPKVVERKQDPPPPTSEPADEETLVEGGDPGNDADADEQTAADQDARKSRSVRRRSTVRSFREKRASLHRMASGHGDDDDDNDECEDKENDINFSGDARSSTLQVAQGYADRESASYVQHSVVTAPEISSEIARVKRRVSVSSHRVDGMAETQAYFLQSLEKLDELADRLQIRTNNAEDEARYAREAVMELEESAHEASERITRAQANEALALAKIKHSQLLSSKRAAAFDLKEQQLREEVLEANSQVAKVTEELQELEDKARHTENSVVTVRQQTATLEATILSQTTALSEKDLQNKAKSNEIIALEASINKVQRQLSSQAAKIDTLNSQIETKSQEIEQLQQIRSSECSTVEIRQLAAEKDIASLEAEKTRFKDDLQVALDQLSEANISSQRLCDEVQELKAEKTDLETRSSDLARQLTDATLERKSLEESAAAKLAAIDEMVVRCRQLEGQNEELERKGKAFDEKYGKESGLRMMYEARVETMSKELESLRQLSIDSQGELKECYKVEQELTGELYEFESLLNSETSKTTVVRQQLAASQDQNVSLKKKEECLSAAVADMKKESELAAVAHKQTRQEYFESVQESKKHKARLDFSELEVRRLKREAGENAERVNELKQQIICGRGERDSLLDELKLLSGKLGDINAPFIASKRALEGVRMDYTKSVERERMLKERVRVLELARHREKMDIDGRAIATGAIGLGVGFVGHALLAGLKQMLRERTAGSETGGGSGGRAGRK